MKLKSGLWWRVVIASAIFPFGATSLAQDTAQGTRVKAKNETSLPPFVVPVSRVNEEHTHTDQNSGDIFSDTNSTASTNDTSYANDYMFSDTNSTASTNDTSYADDDI